MGASSSRQVAIAAPESSGQIKELKQIVAAQDAELKRLNEEVLEVRGRLAKQTKNFRVAQYNILAGYLGDNRQPWFLYGIELTEERRAAIMKKFYTKGEDGKYANAGWPKYVDGILTDAEQACVNEYVARRLRDAIGCAAADPRLPFPCPCARP